MSEKNAYDKIYLIGWYNEYPRLGDFGDEVSWCQDPIGENDECPDIEYIRADLVSELEEKLTERYLKELITIVDAILSENYRDTIECELEDKIKLLKEIYEVFDDVDD